MTEVPTLDLARLYRQVEALRRALDQVYASTTPDHGKWGSVYALMRAYNRFAKEYAKLSGRNNIGLFKEDHDHTSTNTIWPVQKEHFDQLYSEVLILSSLLVEYEVGMSASVSEVADLLSTHLRKVIFSKPDRELDVQNAVESLLVGRGYQKGVHYDRESGRIKYSGKDFIPDFNFHSLQTALEVKLLKEDGNVSSVVEQLSADVTAYKSGYPNVVLCVYDLGAIRDIHEFQYGLQNTDGVRVCVVKH